MLKKFFKVKTEQSFDEGEEIFLFLHRHWLAMLPIILAMVFLILIPVIAFIIFFYLGGLDYLNSLDLSISPSKILVFFFAIYFLFLDFFFLSAWLQYYLDVTIVTSNRIINIDQINIFYRKVAGAKFDFVQDVRAEVTGILQRIFNYGTVMIQTAGEQPNFILENIPQPAMVARNILSIIRKEDIEKEEPLSAGGMLEEHEKEVLENLTQNTPPEEKIKKSATKFDQKSSFSESAKKEKKEEGENKPSTIEEKKSGEINLS